MNLLIRHDIDQQETAEVLLTLQFVQTLRSMSLLRWWKFVWFSLYLGVVGVSPLVPPDAAGLEIVCSAAGVIKLITPAQGGIPVQTHDAGMDCPLCMPQAAPAPPEQDWMPALQTAAHQTLPLPRKPVVVAIAAQPPARGPPFLQ